MIDLSKIEPGEEAKMEAYLYHTSTYYPVVARLLQHQNDVAERLLDMLPNHPWVGSQHNALDLIKTLLLPKPVDPVRKKLIAAGKRADELIESLSALGLEIVEISDD